MADRCIAALYPFKINRLRYVEVASGLVLSVYERMQRIAGINGLSFVRFSPTAVFGFDRLHTLPVHDATRPVSEL